MAVVAIWPMLFLCGGLTLAIGYSLSKKIGKWKAYLGIALIGIGVFLIVLGFLYAALPLQRDYE
jgi:hypothetical protein